eukprot:Protomagalhaensia_sp_Gyna_25__2905@NODE_26_length_7428_cov_115_375829_g18_i0_p3_GENE_NODE_26_length_7428_cov_115_375829_g18_i0NODE_26_length_7428_cov_115_375829_g18_i0_p3_ORF_typecomplete_len264_score37_36RRM_1/PF00076_22/1_7e08RRM_1/PF00076_22/1_9e03PHM7_cyt/PF14703_6/3PHM7_cyt/PF14703_6/1_3_NODE_26_length_7428_cov_115_375829_g18_i030193810
MKSVRSSPPPSSLLPPVVDSTTAVEDKNCTNPAPPCKRKHADSDVVSDNSLSTTTPPPSDARPPKRSKCDNTQNTPPPTKQPQQQLEENKTTLWIGDLERWEDEEYIYHLFNNMTPKSVVSVKIARDREHQKSLGYGFIDFASREIAEQILQAAPAIKRPYGRRFKLTWAKGKTRQPYNPAAAANNSTAAYTTPMSTAIPSSVSWFSSSQTIRTNPTPALVEIAGAEWISDIKNCPVSTDAYKVRQQVLRPSGVEPGVAFVEV